MTLSQTPTGSESTMLIASSPLPARSDESRDLWGSLQPQSLAVIKYGMTIHRLEFPKAKRSYTIGRGLNNDFCFPDANISSRQCTIEWDGEETSGAAVTIINNSSYPGGVWVDSKEVIKGHGKILPDNTEVRFGLKVKDPSANTGRIDFTFRRHNVQHTNSIPAELRRKYDIDFQHCRLGSGAYATVMKALHRTEAKFYAIKVYHEGALLPAAKRREGGAWRHCQREADILPRLTHPNIVKFKEVIQNEGNGVYIVMEFVKGGDLATYLSKQPSGCLGEDACKSIVYQICGALVYLHAEGVVHRDLKPENVLLTDENPPVIKLADFGMAKIVDSKTLPRTRGGTRMYMAPEVLINNGATYDKLVDSWSLGVMVSVMLFRRSPFVTGSDREFDMDVFDQRIISADGLAFISNLLQYEPRDRLSAADAYQHAWLTGSAVTQHPPWPTQASQSTQTQSRAAPGGLLGATSYRDPRWARDVEYGIPFLPTGSAGGISNKRGRSAIVNNQKSKATHRFE